MNRSTPAARLLKSYSYSLRPEVIAQTPITPRDAAKLLVYNPKAKAIGNSTFSNLAAQLPPRSVLVLNDTKVIPARLRVKRTTGGIVEVFVLRQVGQQVTALMNRVCAVGEVLSLGRHRLTVQQRADSEVTLGVSWKTSQLSSILRRYGQTPLPPYLKHSPLTEARRRREYQSVLAKYEGSVAAPTASLHFTPRLLKKLERAGHTIIKVTLHVGLGTFAPVTADQLRRNTLHSESFSISPAAARLLNNAKRERRAIIAVGTTVARTLESAATRQGIQAQSGTTSIFIRPGYRWRFVDGLITNFHVPESSLLMLVASLIGKAAVQRTYQYALRHHYRFLSFGDGMFIKPVV